MKQGWKIKKLGEVCNFSQGIQVPIEEQHTICEEGMIRFLRIIDFTQNGEAPRYINNVDERYILRDKEIAIVRYGTPGYVCYGKKGAIANNLFKVLPKKDTFDFSFLKYWLSSEAFQSVVKGNQYGAALKAIKFSTINEILIPVPPLPEQEKIVAELDCLSGILEKKRQQLKELDALAQTIFYEMFGDPVTNEKGWEVKKLKDVTTKIGSGATPKGGNQSYKESGISLIRSLNVHNNEFTYKDLAYIDDSQATSLNNVILQERDILLNITGASVARCCIVPSDVLPARVNQHVAIIRPKNNVDNDFICYQLTSNVYQQELLSIGKSNGATREALTKSQIESLSVILPPLSLQQSFAKKIESIEKQKELIKQSIAEVETLFNSRMDYYFN